MPVGGSIESVTLKGRNFAVPADTEPTRSLGGWENETEPNGDGTGRLIKKRVSWYLNDLVLSVDDQRRDQDFLQGLADEPNYWPVTVTFADGSIYQGTGQTNGPVEGHSMNSTVSLGIGGPGKMTPQ